VIATVIASVIANADNAVGLILSVLLAGFLVIVLIAPERF
jgi:K+-transporting ATPase KdpF subunit